MATALAPVIGYEMAAKIAQEAFASGQTIRDLVQQRKLMTREQLGKILDARRMTEPGMPAKS